MNTVGLTNTLSRYGNLDGALVLKFQFDLGETRETRIAYIELKAFKNSSKKDSKGDWCKLRITALGQVMFAWREMLWDTNLVLNWPVKVFEHNGIIIIDFDSLHAVAQKGKVNLSGYFLGGKKLLCEEF